MAEKGGQHQVDEKEKKKKKDLHKEIKQRGKDEFMCKVDGYIKIKE